MLFDYTYDEIKESFGDVTTTRYCPPSRYNLNRIGV